MFLNNLWKSSPTISRDWKKIHLIGIGGIGMRGLAYWLLKNGYKVLYNGSLASLSATFTGHYPWFLTYNILNKYLNK